MHAAPDASGILAERPKLMRSVPNRSTGVSTLAKMSVPPWPELRGADRWLIDAMEERLAKTHQSPDELRARAQALRKEAENSDIRGFREAAFALAERYEQAAASRLAAG